MRDRAYIHRRTKGRRRRRGRNTASLTLIHEHDLPADGDATKALDFVGDAVLRALREGFEREVLPSTGEGVGVGFRTGYLARNLVRGPIQGDHKRARCVITAPTDRQGWLEAESKRGNEWMALDGRMGQVIQDALDEYSRRALAREQPRANRGPKRSA